MTESAGPQLSVRADAHRSVEPDSAVLFGGVSVRSESKAAALAAAAAAVQAVLGDLAKMGAVVGSAGAERSPVTWLVTSTTSNPDYDKQTGLQSGFVIASASVQLTVRDFTRLDNLGAALARHESFSMHGVSWLVDADNPAWPDVRAEAIRAAIGKARDYAAALDGQLQRLDHLADTGLLGGDGGGRGYRLLAASGVSGGGGADSPSLDPVPQELTASIEARFTMTPVSLQSR